MDRILNIFRAAALAFAMALISAAGPAAAATLVAVGDLHGDYGAYMAVMKEAGLVDKKGRWSGGDTVLVQTGDIPDRGPDSLKIIRHLMKVEKQAAKKGGAVVALIGNHEAMNMIGDLRYVHPGEYAAFATSKSKKLREAYFKAHFDELAAFYRARDAALDDAGVKAAFFAATPPGYLEHRAAWAPTGEIGKWVASHDAIRIIGDTLFVHGGVGAAYAATPVADINARVRAGLKGAGDKAILEDEQGPLWHRAFSAETPQGEADLTAAIAAYGVKRIVIGHTPNLAGVKALYGGRVVMIDTGLSSHYGGARSFLKIEGGKATGVTNGVASEIALGMQP